MNGLVKLTLGFAAGYALNRALEARAIGLPVRAVFKPNILFLLTPVSKLGTTAPGPDDLLPASR